MGGHDGPRGGFEKHTDKDVVVYCIFKDDKRPQKDKCGEEVEVALQILLAQLNLQLLKIN